MLLHSNSFCVDPAALHHRSCEVRKRQADNIAAKLPKNHKHCVGYSKKEGKPISHEALIPDTAFSTTFFCWPNIVPGTNSS